MKWLTFLFATVAVALSIALFRVATKLANSESEIALLREQIAKQSGPPTTKRRKEGETAISDNRANFPAPTRRETALLGPAGLSASQSADLERIRYFQIRRLAAAMYGPALKVANLSPDETKKMITLYAERHQAQRDADSAARNSGITDPSQIQSLVKAEVEKVDTQIKTELGDDRYNLVQTENAVNLARIQISQGLVPQLASEGYYLSDSDLDSLARAFSEITTSQQSGKLQTPEEVENSRIEAAAKILSPEQVMILKNLDAENARFQELMAIQRGN